MANVSTTDPRLLEVLSFLQRLLREESGSPFSHREGQPADGGDPHSILCCCGSSERGSSRERTPIRLNRK